MKKKISKKVFELSKTKIGGWVVGQIFENFSGMLPLNKIKETDKVIAFWHPKPAYAKHIIVVPKKAIKKITDLKKEDGEYISEAFIVISEIIKELNLEKDGYSVTVNGGSRQEVKQLHFHLYSD
jgi:histidine triad (HIT) family protein